MGTAKIKKNTTKKTTLKAKATKKSSSKAVAKKKAPTTAVAKKTLGSTKDKTSLPVGRDFKKVLHKISKEYGGIDIYSDENAGRLGKALLRLDNKFSAERESLLAANNCNVAQQLYAAINNPSADKLKILEKCRKNLLSNDATKSTCDELLSNFSLLFFKSDLLTPKSAKKSSIQTPKGSHAYIAKIDNIESIPNADFIEKATVSGKSVVVEKNQYHIGDLVVYIKPNIYVKRCFKALEFLKDSDYYVFKKIIKNTLSEGVVIKPSDISITDYSLGDDVSSVVQNQRKTSPPKLDSKKISPKGNRKKGSSKKSGYIDNQDIRHWSEKKFYKNVRSSKQYKKADFESKAEMLRSAKREAKMIKSLRRDAGLGGGICYITTAICEASGKPDDCYELTTLRNFRDNWLAKQPDGLALINKYYETAPGIVNAINALKNRNSIYAFLNRSFLKKCLAFIKNNKMMACKKCYMDMVQYCSKLVAKG